MKKTQNMISELQLHELEMSIINKMNDLLQTSQNLEEAFNIINHTSREVFPELSGGIFLFDTALQQMKRVTQWGDQCILKEFFNREDCWSLREGHSYLIDNSENGIVCYHFTQKPQGGTLCLPQIIQTGMSGLMVLVGDKNNRISPYQQKLATSFNDVIKLSIANIKLRETLRDQSIRDPLTGLFNRRYLNEFLPHQLRRILFDNQKLCVAMLDIDFFKTFNDKFGHEAGDQVLKVIGKILVENFRGTDLACRYGGEEFIVVLPGTGLKQSVERLEKIKNVIQTTQLLFHDQTLPQITVSIGVAEAPQSGQGVDEIIRAADDALYQAKAHGRNRIEVYALSNS